MRSGWVCYEYSAKGQLVRVIRNQESGLKEKWLVSYTVDAEAEDTGGMEIEDILTCRGNKIVRRSRRNLQLGSGGRALGDKTGQYLWGL